MFEPGVDEERLMEHAFELGVEDVISNADGSVEVITSPEEFMNAREVLARAGFRPGLAEVSMRADTCVSINDQETAEKVMNLIDALEDLDDVQSVYSNEDISAEVMEKL